MQLTMTTRELSDALRLAGSAAARFCQRHRASLLEPEEVQQDLLVDLLGRARAYDPRRGPWRPFVLLCFRHRLGRIAQAARHRMLARHPAALDGPAPDQSDCALIDTISATDGFAAWIGQELDAGVQAELHHDLDRAVSGLDGEAAALCVALLRHSPGAPNAVRLSRTTVHRRIRKLRCQLLASGVGQHSTWAGA